MTIIEIRHDSFPPGTLDDFTPDQLADVARAAAEGAHAAVGRLLGAVRDADSTSEVEDDHRSDGWTVDRLDALQRWSVLYDENCDPYVKGPTAWLCMTGDRGICSTTEMLARSRNLEISPEQTAIAQANHGRTRDGWQR